MNHCISSLGRNDNNDIEQTKDAIDTVLSSRDAYRSLIDKRFSTNQVERPQQIRLKDLNRKRFSMNRVERP